MSADAVAVVTTHMIAHVTVCVCTITIIITTFTRILLSCIMRRSSTDHKSPARTDVTVVVAIMLSADAVTDIPL